MRAFFCSWMNELLARNTLWITGYTQLPFPSSEVRPVCPILGKISNPVKLK